MNTQLTPFWYTPEGQTAGSEVQFRLRPLTQPQLVDVEELANRDGLLGGKAYWTAGTLGIIGVKGVTDPRNGEPAALPKAFDYLPRQLVRACGVRLVANDLGLDWEAAENGTLRTGDGVEDPEKN